MNQRAWQPPDQVAGPQPICTDAWTSTVWCEPRLNSFPRWFQCASKVKGPRLDANTGVCAGQTHSSVSGLLLLTVWALNTFSFTFAGLPLGERTSASLSTICLFPLGQLGEEELTPGKCLLTAKVSQVQSWFHFPKRVTVCLILAINWIPGGGDCWKVCVS